MSALQHEPFVFFTTPLLIQAIVAIPFWSLYFGIKYAIEFYEHRVVTKYWDHEAYHAHKLRAYDSGTEPLWPDAWIRERKAGRA